MNFHLMYHLWPVKETDRWKLNLLELKKRWKIFGGHRLLSVATCDRTVRFNEVMRYCDSIGISWTRINHVKNNRRVGEMASLPWLLKTIGQQPMDQSDIVYYAHGKGAKPTDAGRAIAVWTEMMYEATLDYIPVVLELFRRGHPFAGSLRLTNKMMGVSDNMFWYYAGTFFWFRPSMLSSSMWKNARKVYHGVEFWPGQCFAFEQAGDIFTPDIGTNNGQIPWAAYSYDHWQKYYLPAFSQWEKDNAHFRIIW